MSLPAVVATDLRKVYEPTPKWMRVFVRSGTQVPVTALHDVSFSVAQGRICVVIGPNGAGKSTLFRILTGLTTPSGGRSTVLGMDPVIDAHQIRRHVGFMPAEDRTLFLRHTSRQNLRFHGRLQGISETKLKNRIDDVLDIVGLGHAKDRAGFAMSSGMRARLMFARAILHEPAVLILDEPTGAIDPIGAHEFLDLIVKITIEQQTATLISSHRLEEIETLRDNVLLLDNGRMVFSGNLDDIKAVADKKTYEVACIDAEAAKRVVETMQKRLSTSTVIGLDGSLVLVRASADSQVDLAWLADLGHEVESLALRRLSLRETISTLLSNAQDR